MSNTIIDTTLERARQYGDARFLDNGLVLTDLINDAVIPAEPKRMNFILMALCRRGEARYSVDTQQRHVSPGDLFFVSEGHIVDHYVASADFDCLCIMVSTDFYHSFVQSVQNVSSVLIFSISNPVVRLTEGEIQVYTRYYQAIRHKLADTTHHYRTEVVKSLLLAMFYDMSDVIWRVQHSRDSRHTRAEALFAGFVRLLEQHYRSERRISWYAEQLNITPKYLSDVVKRVSQHTPGDWVENYVVLEMRVQLSNTTRSIKEIADSLHFPNQSFMGKYFKEHTGMSPSEFRRQIAAV